MGSLYAEIMCLIEDCRTCEWDECSDWCIDMVGYQVASICDNVLDNLYAEQVAQLEGDGR